MRAVILLIVFISGLFADTIHHRLSFIISDVVTKNDVEYLGINNNKIFFKNNAGVIQSTSCRLVIDIYDSQNNKIDFDCKSNTYNEDGMEINKTPLVNKIIFAGVITFALILLIAIIAERDISVDTSGAASIPTG